MHKTSFPTSQRLQNKVSLITGAAQGIGLATALKFAHEGAILSGPERAQNGHGGVILSALGWRELAGLDSPTRPDKPRHDVTKAVVFSESVCFECPESTTGLQHEPAQRE